LSRLFFEHNNCIKRDFNKSNKEINLERYLFKMKNKSVVLDPKLIRNTSFKRAIINL